MYKHIKFFKEISLPDISQVGGKNASLGEMYQHLAPKGINLPNGFATTAQSYYYFLESAGIKDKIEQVLKGLDVSHVRDLKKRVCPFIIMRAKLPKILKKKFALDTKSLADSAAKTTSS